MPDQLDPNERDPRGRTPLILFVTNRMPLEGIQLLLDKNVDLEEQREVDDILYEESIDKMYGMIRKLSSPVLLHAVVNDYNWDDGPEPMIAAFENPACAGITLLDMYELMDGEYWLEQSEEVLSRSTWKLRWRRLAEELRDQIDVHNKL